LISHSTLLENGMENLLNKLLGGQL
jgi:hypothetical protein